MLNKVGAFLDQQDPTAFGADLLALDQAFRNIDEDLCGAPHISGIHYTSMASRINELIDDIQILEDYAKNLENELTNNVDHPFYINFNHNATQLLSYIRIEDFHTSNSTLHIQELVDHGGQVPWSSNADKWQLGFSDFMVDTKHPEVDNINTYDPNANYCVNDFVGLFRDEYDNMPGVNRTLSYEDYIKSLSVYGEYDHSADEPIRDFISHGYTLYRALMQ